MFDIPWLTFIKSGKAAFAWLKENWKVPFVVAYTIVVWILARGNIDAVKDVLEARKKAHVDEVNSLKERNSSLKEKKVQDHQKVSTTYQPTG